MKAKKSQTYYDLIELMLQLSKQAIVNPIYANQLGNNVFTRTSTNANSSRVPQPLVMADAGLFAKCTSSEWYLIGYISAELKEYNALWQCQPEIKKSSTQRQAINGLIAKQVLIKTETTNIFIVNPLYLRRGDLFTVISTTANTLCESVKVLPEHITNKRPVKSFMFDHMQRANNIQLGYGYADIPENTDN